MENVGEQQYLDLIQEVMSHGEIRTNGTKALFHKTLYFDLQENFPLLTTKLVSWRAVVLELLWFISGNTSSKTLSEQGVNIWSANGSRAQLDALGFKDREEGDLGPVYGFQWRHFGATYVDAATNYQGQGVDQLANVIRLLKEKPTDRRIILSAWNPADQHLMALPPCHMFAQFYVDANKGLECFVYMRSSDVGLGLPFNIASYALLTHMLAHVCGLHAKCLHMGLGDTHIYLNHEQGLCEQLLRKPKQFPTLKLNDSVHNIDDFRFSDFTLQNYMHHPSIKLPLTV